MFKRLLSGLVTAFSMYSIVPMPNLEWNKDTMKYAMCFFPFVGAVIGGCVYGMTLLCSYFGISPLLFAAVLTLIPVIVSGAIHIDGLIDTGDAVYSRLPKERKLEILKDPHVGAFGVILCVCYFILNLGLAGQFYTDTSLLPILCLGYILSRSMSALSIVSLKTAKDSGLAHIFSDNADKKTVKITNIVYIIATLCGMIYINPLAGGIIAVLSLLWLLLFKRFCYKSFGGLTGDLAGYMLCITEIAVLAVAAIV